MKFLTEYILLIPFFLVANFNSSFCQQLNSNKVKQEQASLNTMDSKIRQWQRDLNIPNVAIAIIENNKVIKAKVYRT